MGKLLLLVAAAALMFAGGEARAGFKGKLELIPDGCKATGQCSLKEEFGYIDPYGVGWLAKQGLVTDGASIPAWARPIVGQPFEDAFIKAAVIHDHYCDRHVRPWRQTHRVFYDALRESGVTKSKAGIMYFAILVGGPKWVKLVKGKPCALGSACINSLERAASMPGTNVELGEGTDILMTRHELYGSPRFESIMAEKRPVLESKGEDLSMEDVEKEAAKAMAGDLYFSNGDEVGGELGDLSKAR